MVVQPEILWNPVNLVEGEGRWIILELAILFGTLFITKALDLLVRLLSKRIKNVYFDIVSASLCPPIIGLLWCIAALLSFDIVTDGFLSEGHSKGWSLLFSMLSLCTFSWFLFRLKNRLIKNAIASRTKNATPPETFSILALSKLFTILIVIVILILFNDITGLSLTTLLAFGGVGGLALAFASQEIISNFFGGLMVHITRPFVVNELIYFPSNNVEGFIEEIGWYQTRIRSLNKTAVYVPNALFTKALVINKSRATHRPLDITLYVESQDVKDLKSILDALTKYLQENPEIDQQKWSGARLISIGPTSSILVSGITKELSDNAYYRLCDDISIKVAQIVEAHKARLASGPQTILVK